MSDLSQVDRVTVEEVLDALEGTDEEQEQIAEEILWEAIRMEKLRFMEDPRIVFGEENVYYEDFEFTEVSIHKGMSAAAVISYASYTTNAPLVKSITPAHDFDFTNVKVIANVNAVFAVDGTGTREIAGFIYAKPQDI